MSFVKRDFEFLSRDNRIKKVLYGIKQLLNNTKDEIYINNLLQWLFEYENIKINPANDKSGWIQVYNFIFDILKKENPFIEDEPFDREKKIKSAKNIKLLLDNIRSPHNVGSIIRTCECFGIEEIILTGITPSAENNAKIKKTAMGCNAKNSYAQNAHDVIMHYKEKGFKIYAIEKTKKSICVDGIKIEIPSIIILGNEEFGISKEILSLSDMILHIDLLGFKNSLNVSVACGIVLYELSKNLK
jgi:tRNA G18 (ribose-2'-O)-methylase SpoU